MLKKLLIGRILYWLRKNGLLSTRKYGFTPQKGAVDKLMEVKKVERRLARNEHVLLISMDVAGKFDAAYWPSILMQLAKYGRPQNLFNLSKDYFSQRLATVTTGVHSFSQWAEKGYPQGSCCGPGYWVIMYDTLLKLEYPAGVQVFAFADDLLMVVSARDEQELSMIANQSIYLIEQWSVCNKDQFNPDKSQLLHITRRKRKCIWFKCSLWGKFYQWWTNSKF